MQSVSRIWTLGFGMLLIVASCNSDKNTKPEKSAGDSVLKEYATLINKSPEDASLYLDRGKYLYEQASYDAAIEDLKKAIEIDSLNPTYYYLLSDIYLDYYQSKNALFTLQTAAHLFPNDIRTQLKLSEDFYILKDQDNALIHAHKVLNIDPNNGEAYFMIGLINQEFGNRDNAIKSFKKAIDLDPDIVDGWIMVGELLASKNDPAALQYFDGAIESDRSNINAYHSKAFYLQNHEAIPEALSIYDQIHRIDKQYEPAYLNSGILFLELDSLQKAYDKFNILVNIDPDNALGFYYRGLTNQYLGKSDLARNDFETALTFDPGLEKAQKALDSL